MHWSPWPALDFACFGEVGFEKDAKVLLAGELAFTSVVFLLIAIGSKYFPKICKKFRNITWQG